jgi:hypothetical protein
MSFKFSVFALVALTISAIAQPQISVNPDELEFELFEGETALDSLLIGNPGTDTLQFTIHETFPQTEPLVEILAWIAYADLDEEWANMVGAINQYLTNFTLDTTSTLEANVLAGLLSTRTVLLIPEQESAPNLANIGIAWAGVLNDFVLNGGMVFILDHYDDAVPLVNSARLMQITWIGHCTSQDVQVLDTSHPFVQGLPQTFQVLDGNNWHTSNDGTCLLRMVANNYNNLTYKYLGSGTVIYWGADFYSYNTPMAQLLCNVLECSNNLSWVGEFPTNGSVPPGGTQIVQVRVNSTNLVPDTYEAVLQIRNNTGDSTDVLVPVTLTVNPPPPPTIAVAPDSVGVTVPMGTLLMDSILITNLGPGILDYTAQFYPESLRTVFDKSAKRFFPPVSKKRSSEKPRQSKYGKGLTGLTDELYTGQFLHFGISDSYGEIMPYQYPIGNEHLFNGSYVCGYHVSYLPPAGDPYIAWTSYEERLNISPGTYEELINTPQMIQVKTSNLTSNGAISVTQIFTFDCNNKFIAVSAKIKNIGAQVCNDLYYKAFADWDVDTDWDDDDWDYDVERNMEFAYDSNYCTLTPVTPQPIIIDVDGWDDYSTRPTALNMPPGPYINEDGCLLLHYECGDLAPGQEYEIFTVFASGSDLADLQSAVDAGSAFITSSWVTLMHPAGRLAANSSSVLEINFNARDCIPGINIGYIEIACNDPVNPIIEVPVTMTVTPLNLNVTAAPVAPPVVIPATGGDFVYSFSVANLQEFDVRIDIWNNSISPDSTRIKHDFVWEAVEIAALDTFDTTLIQAVPAGWPAGISLIGVNAGVFDEAYICDSAYFSITKLGLDGFEGLEPDIINSLGEFSIQAPYPNPFNNETTLSFTLPEITQVSLMVYDIRGRLVSVIAQGEYSAGAHRVIFNAEKLASGIYFIRMEAGIQKRIFKVLLTK